MKHRNKQNLLLKAPRNITTVFQYKNKMRMDRAFDKRSHYNEYL